MSTSGDKRCNITLSVIIPCFNQGQYLLEAIASVESCQAAVYEIIIVNDGSTDELTHNILTTLKTKGYCVIDQANQGLAEARNTGIRVASGRYILPLDADNKIYPDYITESIQILDQFPEVGVVYSNAELFGEITGVREVPKFDINRIAAGNYIDACAVFRKHVWEDCGGYDANIPNKIGYEDWDFWLGATEKGWNFYHIDKVLFAYRFRVNSMVSACNIPENRQALFRYISSKHIKLYSSNFAEILAQKELYLLQETVEKESLQTQLKHTKKELDQVRSQLQANQDQLRQTQANFQQSEAELTRSHEAFQTQDQQRAQLYSELQTTQAELARSHNQLQQAKAELIHLETCLKDRKIEETQLAQTQTELEKTKADLMQSEALLTQLQTQIDGEIIQSRSQLEEMRSELTRSQAESQHIQTQLIYAQNTITAMETSKFWQLRSQWFKVKKALGFGEKV